MAFARPQKHFGIEESDEEGDFEDDDDESCHKSRAREELRSIGKFFWRHKIATCIGTILLLICVFPFWVAATYVFDDYPYNENKFNYEALKRDGNPNYTVTCQKHRITNELPVKLSMITIYCVIFVTGIFGNVLVLYVIFHYYKMRTVTNLFIANLAVSDLLVSCSSLWLTPLYTWTGRWIWGQWLCYIFPLFQGTSIFISTLTLMSIAVDRYFVICHHSLVNANINEHLTMPVCISIIATIWTVSLSLVMPYAVHMRLAYIHEPCNFYMCIEDWARAGLKSIFGFVVLFLQFILPFGIIIISYRSIWVFLNKRYRKPLKKYRNEESKRENKKRRRLLRMLMTMVFVFALCWLPVNALNLMRDTVGITAIKRYFEFFFLFSHMVSMMCTAFNPLLYAWMNESFRKHFVDAVPLLNYVLDAEQKQVVNRKIVTDCTPARNRVSCADNVGGSQALKKHKLSNTTIVTTSNAVDSMEMKPLRSAMSDNNVDVPAFPSLHHRLGIPSNTFKSASFNDITQKQDTAVVLKR